MADRISVIIPALDEQDYIRYALDGLRKQSMRNFETIVVDGGSSDRTVSIAKSFANVITCRKRGTGRARNMGARKATGNILLFIDADTKPSPKLLETYSGIFSCRDIVAATGPIYPIDSNNFWIRKGYEFVSVFLVRLSILVGRPAIVGSNFAVRASKFRAAGGFDESLMTYEDWALSNKIKKYGKVEYSKKAVVHTSARRIKSWGIFGYVAFYLTDAIMYKFTGRSRKMYEIVR